MEETKKSLNVLRSKFSRSKIKEIRRALQSRQKTKML